MEPKVRSETINSGVARSRTTIVHASSLTRIAARCVVHGFRAQLLEPSITLTVCFLLPRTFKGSSVCISSSAVLLRWAQVIMLEAYVKENITTWALGEHMDGQASVL